MNDQTGAMLMIQKNSLCCFDEREEGSFRVVSRDQQSCCSVEMSYSE